MEYITQLWNYFKVNILGMAPETKKVTKTNSKQPILNKYNKAKRPNEIKMVRDISDAQIQANMVRAKYLQITKHGNHKIQKGENVATIAKKYGVEEASILMANRLNKDTAKSLQIGQVLKIPNSRKAKNVRSLNDIAKSLGVSVDFIRRLKTVEDNKKLSMNQFHNTPYDDGLGNPTIGIGHLIRKGDPKRLSNAQVCELCANDLLKVEENLFALLGGKQKYDRLPTGIKEALLDMGFNKGTGSIKNTPGLLYCLKIGKYEAAINKFTNVKSEATGEEMAGLCKRRLFDISLGMKMYNGKIPKSNLNTAQQIYNKGVALLRAECKRKHKNFQDQLVGFNQDVKSYLGNKIKFITK